MITLYNVRSRLALAGLPLPDMDVFAVKPGHRLNGGVSRGVGRGGVLGR